MQTSCLQNYSKFQVFFSKIQFFFSKIHFFFWKFNFFLKFAFLVLFCNSAPFALSWWRLLTSIVLFTKSRWNLQILKIFEKNWFKPVFWLSLLWFKFCKSSYIFLNYRYPTEEVSRFLILSSNYIVWKFIPLPLKFWNFRKFWNSENLPLTLAGNTRSRGDQVIPVKWILSRHGIAGKY